MLHIYIYTYIHEYLVLNEFQYIGISYLLQYTLHLHVLQSNYVFLNGGLFVNLHISKYARQYCVLYSRILGVIIQALSLEKVKKCVNMGMKERAFIYI